MDEKTKPVYTSTDGEIVDVVTLNNFHLLNALIKNVKLSCGALEDLVVTNNLQALKAEILFRLAPAPAEAETPSTDE